MKRVLIFLIGFFSLSLTFGQTAADALNPDNQTLRERYLLMRNKSQNYQEYKVIKENVLDSWWKIVLDSVTAKQTAIRDSKAEIKRLETELSQNIDALKAKENSMKDVMYASTHISVLGIAFDKGFFAGMVGVILLLAGLAIAGVLYSIRMIKKSLTEKEELANSISVEYEEYKRKAMEKQTKLSRELQNERNKLQELGSL